MKKKAKALAKPRNPGDAQIDRAFIALAVQILRHHPDGRGKIITLIQAAMTYVFGENDGDH